MQYVHSRTASKLAQESEHVSEFGYSLSCPSL